MGIEWAWLRDDGARRADVRSIDLAGTATCSVLLFHGLTGGPLELAYIAQYLNRRGKLGVACPALINHGQPLAVLARTRWQELWQSACMHFLAASARAKENHVRLVVGGLSIGGVLALMLAAEFASEIAGVVCLSPTLFYDGWNVPWFHRLLPLVDYSPLKYFAYLREEPPYGLRDEVLRERIRREYQRASLADRGVSTSTYAHFPIRLLCETRHLIRRCIKMLPQVSAPLLVVQSADDDATSPKNAQYVVDHAASQDTRMLLLENSYHLVTADLEREKVASAMVDFCIGVESVHKPVPDEAGSGLRNNQHRVGAAECE